MKINAIVKNISEKTAMYLDLSMRQMLRHSLDTTRII